jgi:hypothetical protein
LDESDSCFEPRDVDGAGHFADSNERYDPVVAFWSGDDRSELAG